MKAIALALALLVPVLTARSQDTQETFDADSFFSAATAGTGAPEPDPALAGYGSYALSPAYGPAGLAFTGEANIDLLFAISEPFDGSSRSAGYTGITSLRIDVLGGDRNEAKVEASAIVRMVYGDGADAVRAAASEALANPELEAYLLGDSGPVVSLELKKLYLSIYTQHADLSAGRMIINYGRGTVFSPVDLFSSVDTADLGLGRLGTDALRVLLPLGSFSGLDLVAALGDASGAALAGGRLYGNSAGVDFGVSLFGDGLADGDGDLVAAMDFKGDLELGISAEAVARVPFAEWVPRSGDAVYSLMLGADYSLGGEWLFDLEYLWNLRAGSEFAVGSFRSEHNLFSSLSWQPDELTALDLRCIIVPSGGAMQATLSLSRDVAKGARISGFALYRSGDVEGRFLGSAMPPAGDGTIVSLGMRLSVAY
ncbi:MAG: hypothetical protein E4H20_10270 [Spirochaetales bacterium]|nr:MAG: hypothetical protein E4H20_10270 [Spirochaetales bacterium]